MLEFLATVRKALMGGLTSAAAAIGVGMADGRMSTEDWALVIGFTAFGLVGVYAIPNKAS